MATDAQIDAGAFLDEALADPECGFSIGVAGAIAEFLRSDGVAELKRDGSVRIAFTRDGAMRIALTSKAVPVAAELPSKRPGHWQQQVSFCLCAADAGMAARSVLTELGPDADAIDASGRRQLRFDLGLNLAHVDACIRTADTQLIALLRRFAGRALLTEAREAVDAIIAESPARVFCSRLGRIEVFSPIPERNTPMGPHTHLLPALLGRPSPIARFIPTGLVSCLDVYPGNPARMMSGKTRPFDPDRHARFQQLLESWGLPEYVAEKRRVAAWVRQGKPPQECPSAEGPLAELGRRVVLRQLAFDGADEVLLAVWNNSLDPA